MEKCLIEDASEVQVLTSLGLSMVQAKVYYVLANAGVLKISEVSKRSGISRPDVYRTLTQLYDLGLVEKVLQAPVQYKALSLNEGIEALLSKKQAERAQLEHEAKLLLSTFDENSQQLQEEVGNDFIMLTKKGAIISMGKKNIDEARLRMDFLVTWKRFLGGFCNVYLDNLLKAKKRGVKVRFLVQKPSEDVNLNNTGLAKFVKIFEIRFIENIPHTLFGIVDGQKGYIITNPTSDLTGTTGIWTNNHSLISLVQEYFDMLWLEEGLSIDLE